jgi:hypothetical protein
MMTREASYKISFYNFILAVIILMGHIGFGGWYEPINDIDAAIYEFWPNLITELVRTALRLYMIMSAFLLYYNATMENIWRKIASRIVSLVIPYVIWNLIYVLYLGFVEKQDILSAHQIINGLLTSQFDGPLWFILSVISFLPLAPLLARLKKGWTVIGVAGVIYIAACSGLAANIPIAGWFVGKWGSFGLAYFGGYILARLCPDFILKERFPRRILAVISFAIILFIYTMNLFHISLGFISGQIGEIITAICLWFLIPACMLDRYRRDKNDIPYIFKISFLIYASHVLVAKLWLRFFITPYIYSRGAFSGWKATLIKLGTQLLVLGTITIVSWCAERLLPEKIFQLFSGGRTRRKPKNGF